MVESFQRGLQGHVSSAMGWWHLGCAPWSSCTLGTWQCRRGALSHVSTSPYSIVSERIGFSIL